MKKKCGCFIILLFAVSILFLLMVFIVAGGRIDWRLESYAATENAQMPPPDMLSGALDVVYQHYVGNFWGEEAEILIVRYDEEMYAKRKREIEESTEFQTEPVRQYGEHPDILPVFSMDRFDVRLLKCEESPYAAGFPEEMDFIGFCDESGEVLYIGYDDLELDCMSGQFEENLPGMIHWKSVKWPQRFAWLRNIRLPVLY